MWKVQTKTSLQNREMTEKQISWATMAWTPYLSHVERSFPICKPLVSLWVDDPLCFLTFTFPGPTILEDLPSIVLHGHIWCAHFGGILSGGFRGLAARFLSVCMWVPGDYFPSWTVRHHWQPQRPFQAMV